MSAGSPQRLQITELNLKRLASSLLPFVPGANLTGFSQARACPDLDGFSRIIIRAEREPVMTRSVNSPRVTQEGTRGCSPCAAAAEPEAWVAQLQIGPIDVRSGREWAEWGHQRTGQVCMVRA